MYLYTFVKHSISSWLTEVHCDNTEVFLPQAYVTLSKRCCLFRLSHFVFMHNKVLIWEYGMNAIPERKVWRYQRSNRKPHIAEGQNNTIGGELRCSGRENSSCSTTGKRRLTVYRHQRHPTRKSYCTPVDVNTYKYTNAHKLNMNPYNTKWNNDEPHRVH